MGSSGRPPWCLILTSVWRDWLTKPANDRSYCHDATMGGAENRQVIGFRAQRYPPLRSSDLLSGNVHFQTKQMRWKRLKPSLSLNAEFHFAPIHARTRMRKCEALPQSGWAGSRLEQGRGVYRSSIQQEIFRWMQKAYAEWCRSATVVCLVPGTDTRWFQTYAMEATQIRWIKDAQKFNRHKTPRHFRLLWWSFCAETGNACKHLTTKLTPLPRQRP